MNKKIIAFTIEDATSEDYKNIKNKIISVTHNWAKLDETLYLVKTERSSVNLREIIREVSLTGKLKMVFVSN